MSEHKNVYIFGYSGHAYVIIESLLQAGYRILGYFDMKEATKDPYNLTYLGSEDNSDVKKVVGNNLVFPAVGSNLVREKMINFFDTHGLEQFVLIDPSAIVSPTASIGVSTYVGKNVIVNAQSKISKGVILNSGCIVEHECNISNYVHIAPGTVLCGNVNIGEKTFVGAKVVVKQNISICADVTIGAGSIVVKDINTKGTWLGCPIKKYEK